MRIPRTWILFSLIVFVSCVEKDEELDASDLLLEATKSFLKNKEALGGLQQMAQGFMNPVGSDTKMNRMMENGGEPSLGGQLLQETLQAFMGAVSNSKEEKSSEGVNVLSMLGPALQMLSQATGGLENSESKNEPRDESQNGGGFDMGSLLNVASMFVGENGNADGLMGLLPMILDNMGSMDTSGSSRARSNDHSSHSWFMPPVLENLHLMWDHFRNSELGRTLWRNSGLQNIFSSMVDEKGRVKYEKMFDSFENPSLRRRWIRSMTNFVAEWIAYISEPTTRQKHVNGLQFVANSFLKSQGYPKAAMFDASKPVESLSRLVNTGAKKHLNLEIDSQQYIKPAIAYVQDLMKLASEKGFIMSRVNANELSNRLSETINNDLVSPLLKAYRAYKWAIKSPKCAQQIFCAINERSNEIEDEGKMVRVRATLTRGASYLAAWIISSQTGDNFWSLYGAIQESDGCFRKYPVDCEEFHTEEIRVTTEAAHNEL